MKIPRTSTERKQRKDKKSFVEAATRGLMAQEPTMNHTTTHNTPKQQGGSQRKRKDNNNHAHSSASETPQRQQRGAKTKQFTPQEQARMLNAIKPWQKGVSHLPSAYNDVSPTIKILMVLMLTTNVCTVMADNNMVNESYGKPLYESTPNEETPATMTKAKKYLNDHLYGKTGWRTKRTWIANMHDEQHIITHLYIDNNKPKTKQNMDHIKNRIKGRSHRHEKYVEGQTPEKIEQKIKITQCVTDMTLHKNMKMEFCNTQTKEKRIQQLYAANNIRRTQYELFHNREGKAHDTPDQNNTRKFHFGNIYHNWNIIYIMMVDIYMQRSNKNTHK